MPAPTIYVATSNPGKLRDFAAAAANFEVSIVPVPCLDMIPPPVEDELTFKGNAQLKAIYYSRLAPGFTILADDSGLEVDALDGGPGVRSARYAVDSGIRIDEEGLSHDQANNTLLLRNLVGVPEADRTARYRCVLALARDGQCLVTADGAIEGRIATEPRGDRGFGYDPLFLLPALGLTMAELDLDSKNAISHRGLALQSLFAKINGQAGPQAEQTNQ